MTAEWNQAVDTHTDLISFWRSYSGLQYASGFAESVAARGGINSAGEKIPHLDTAAAMEGITAAVQLLPLADVIWVDEDVVDLVEYAAVSF